MLDVDIYIYIYVTVECDYVTKRCEKRSQGECVYNVFARSRGPSHTFFFISLSKYSLCILRILLERKCILYTYLCMYIKKYFVSDRQRNYNYNVYYKKKSINTF